MILLFVDIASIAKEFIFVHHQFFPLLQEIIIAIQSFLKAHRFISRHRLWKWIWIPGLVYLILFAIGIYFFIRSAHYPINLIFEYTGIKDWMQGVEAGWLKFLILFGQIILQVVILLFYFSLFKYFFLIIGSPVFAYLSEKTEAILENKDFPFNLKRFLLDILRGIRIALRNAFWQTMFFIALFMLSFIPVAGWFMPLLTLFIEFYYLGFSMLDYTNERRGRPVRESIEFINRHKGLAIGNGMIFYLMLSIPVLGWIMAPGYAVIAATLSLQGKE